jgi:predicted Zn-dependent protease
MDSQIEDLMNKAVNHALQIGAVVAEVRGEDTTRGNIEAVDNEIRTVSVVRSGVNLALRLNRIY